MAAKSNYLENKIIDFIFRGGTFTAPSALYVALLTAAPSDSGGGTEVSGGSYARQNLAPSASNWASTGGATSTTNPSAGTSGTTSNNVAIVFPTPTADWGTITHVGIFDASTSGNLLYWAPATTPLTVNNGGSPYTFAISALSIQEDN